MKCTTEQSAARLVQAADTSIRNAAGCTWRQEARPNSGRVSLLTSERLVRRCDPLQSHRQARRAARCCRLPAHPLSAAAPIISHAFAAAAGRRSFHYDAGVSQQPVVLRPTAAAAAARPAVPPPATGLLLPMAATSSCMLLSPRRRSRRHEQRTQLATPIRHQLRSSDVHASSHYRPTRHRPAHFHNSTVAATISHRRRQAAGLPFPLHPRVS